MPPSEFASSAASRSSRQRPSLACRVLAATALLASCATGQGIGSTLAPQLFGPKYVLYRYWDRKCTRPMPGQGAAQSWTRVVDAPACYELTTGMLCTFRCVIKLGCQYDTGSGVQVEVMADTTCKGSGDPKPFAEHLYWVEAKSLFEGGCVSDGSGRYVKFGGGRALEPEHWPDCERFGAVMPGGDDIAYKYEDMYTLQFYKDMTCQEEYVVDAFADRPTSQYSWRLFRGAQYCYDIVDTTPQLSNNSLRTTLYDKMNWRMVCGNPDSKGNGYMIEHYTGAKCTDRGDGGTQWENAFYPMNFPATEDLLKGRCTLWGKYRVKFNKPFNTFHFPDCSNWACQEGACTGGRIRAADDRTGEYYSGSIRTSGADPADSRSFNATVAASHAGSHLDGRSWRAAAALQALMVVSMALSAAVCSKN